MQYRLSAPDTLQATIGLPASKSISNRALILHALSQGKAQLSNLSDCDDTRVMIRALNTPQGTIDIQAAGTAMRFLTAYLSVASDNCCLLTGTERMQQRPIRILVDALRSLGARIEYAGNEGFPPLRITGTRLTGNQATLAGNVSSQYISALLMIGPMLPQGLTLRLTGHIISRPYIELTLQLMRDFGARVEWTAADCITAYPGGYQDVSYTVESDWSAASYWYEIMALFRVKNRKEGRREDTIKIELPGLFEKSYQGDSRGATLFARLGIKTQYTPTGIILSSGDTPVSRLEADLIDIPDLAQTFVATCCLMDIPFRFTGLQSLKIKETDRLAALINELRKLGYALTCEENSTLAWNGERCRAHQTPVISTYEDHRMAMAFAPASLLVPDLCIDKPEVVSKSYPCFWKDLQKAGFHIQEDA